MENMESLEREIIKLLLNIGVKGEEAYVQADNVCINSSKDVVELDITIK